MIRNPGILDRWLSNQRTRKAVSMIGPGNSICDIGCGVLPEFVIGTDYSEKYVIDPAYRVKSVNDISLLPNNLDTITMLAVLEHITAAEGRKMVEDARQKLRPGGILFITTPAGWTANILNLMAKLNLVSRVEIAEHKCYYCPAMLMDILSGYSRVDVGYFEFGLNLWAKAVK